MRANGRWGFQDSPRWALSLKQPSGPEARYREPNLRAHARARVPACQARA